MPDAVNPVVFARIMRAIDGYPPYLLPYVLDIVEHEMLSVLARYAVFAANRTPKEVANAFLWELSNLVCVSYCLDLDCQAIANRIGAVDGIAPLMM